MFRQISEVCLCVKYDKVVLRRHAGTHILENQFIVSESTITINSF
jgi:hypothetical protein